MKAKESPKCAPENFMPHAGTVQRAIQSAETTLQRRGRVVVRYSGTEALARVMIEGDDTEVIRRLAEDIISAFEKEVGVG